MRIVRHVTLRGQVQGVGFRYFVVQCVLDILDRNLGLEGWVRNRSDGSVEALFAGEPDVVAEIIEACRKGPTGARVEAVEEREGDPTQIKLRLPGQPFSLLATA
jgi:acylphosphatase